MSILIPFTISFGCWNRFFLCWFEIR